MDLPDPNSSDCNMEAKRWSIVNLEASFRCLMNRGSKWALANLGSFVASELEADDLFSAIGFLLFEGISSDDDAFSGKKVEKGKFSEMPETALEKDSKIYIQVGLSPFATSLKASSGKSVSSSSTVNEVHRFQGSLDRVLSDANQSGIPPSLITSLECCCLTLKDLTLKKDPYKKMNEQKIWDFDEAQIQACIQSWKRKYQETRLEYSQEQTEHAFHKSYSALVNFSEPIVFDSLIRLEMNYAAALQKDWEQHEADRKELKARHDAELNRLKMHKISNTREVLSRHAEV